jgi:PAS domain S-box-containing protein
MWAARDGPRFAGEGRMNALQAATGWAGLFETAFKRSGNAMALTDDERRLVKVNGAMSRLLGRRPSELVGHHTYDFVAGGPLLSREDWRHTIGRGDVTGEAELLCEDGSTAIVQFAVHPEIVTGHQMVLFVVLTVSRWGRHFRREHRNGAEGDLSPREREVLSLVAQGETSTEIAAALQISHNTVRKHVNSAMRKLGARSRAHLVAKALGEARVA